MALPQSTAHADTYDDFAHQVVSNIDTTIKLRRTTRRAAAAEAGLTETQMSQRMTGKVRWLASEIVSLATVLKVDPGVLLAKDTDQYRERLFRGGDATTKWYKETAGQRPLTAVATPSRVRLSEPKPPLLYTVPTD